MTMDDKIEATIKDIATKHGIAISPDDPIMVLHTMNEGLIRETQEAHQAMLDQFGDQLNKSREEWELHAKGRAEKTLNAAILSAKATIANTMTEGAGKIRNELKTTLKEVQLSERQVQKTLVFTLAAAGIAVMSTGVMVFMLLR